MTSTTAVRTCIGCRVRADQTELVRVALDRSTEPPSVVWDRCRRRPGRGAWLHPAPECLHLAERRRAFPRAFRAAVDVDGLMSGRDHCVAEPNGSVQVGSAPPADRPMNEGGSEI